MKKICFIAKTDINVDGRILNELQMLHDNFKNIEIDFILIPDKEVKIEHRSLFKLHVVNSKIRNNIILRPLTALILTLKSVFKIKKIKPDIIHVQDSASALTILTYLLFSNRRLKVLYDDHELPKENANIFKRINVYFEGLLIKKADFVLFANEERKEIIEQTLKPRGKTSYLLNLPYYEEENDDILTENNNEKLSRIDSLISNGTSFIIHQGPILKERGAQKIAEFSKNMTSHYKLLLVGGTLEKFNEFMNEFKLDSNKFHFVGTVDYWILSKFWERASAAIVMYLPTYINNRLCAPNRLYLAYEFGLPIIVNKANPVLNNFITKHDCGLFIEDITSGNFEVVDNFNKYSKNGFENLKSEQIQNFIELYQEMLDNNH